MMVEDAEERVEYAETKAKGLVFFVDPK